MRENVLFKTKREKATKGWQLKGSYPNLCRIFSLNKIDPML